MRTGVWGDIVAHANYLIGDEASFEAVAGNGHEIAGLYAYAKLDDLIDLARCVSLDFFARPEYYKRFRDDGVAEALAQLNARYGSDERILSREQRAAIFAPLFDDPSGNFVGDRDAVLSAAATYAEGGQPTGERMLRDAAKTAHANFMAQLSHFSGASLNWSRQRVLSYLTNEVSYRILREPGVCAVFGVVDAPGPAWPYSEDANGDMLVEEISRRVDPKRPKPLTRHAFRLQQRAALRGAEAIAAIIDYGPAGDADALEVMVSRCYTWYAALQGVTGMGRVNAAVTGADGTDARVAGAGNFLPQ